ncbi:MAG: PHP domain-containing protein [bacterium]|nr:PHP domain-containing protein [Candidatus Sumerlaeota bacterium]
MTFVHLHVHSYYSEDGVANPHDLVSAARDMGMNAIALTDHNTLGGIVPFCLACREFGIRPIIGCELNVAASESKLSSSSVYKLVLLVETEAGYRNLVKLLQRSHANARHDTPFLRLDDLRNNTNGLIVLTGGTASELQDLLMHGKHTQTEAHLTQLERVFGRQSIIFEIQDYHTRKHQEIADRIAAVAYYFAMPCVATNDVHYLRPHDSICHDFLKSEAPPLIFEMNEKRKGSHTKHLASAEEMAAKFHRHPRALSTTEDVAERCAFQLNFEKRRFPVHDFVRGQDADSYLWDLAFREARGRYAELSNEMKNRLNQEFDCIKEEGLSNNIILLHKVAQFCRQNKISLGVGKGHIISSLVAYVLGITQINPLDHKMKFLGFGSHGIKGRSLGIELPACHASALHAFLKSCFGEDFCCAVGRHTACQRANLAREICAWFNYSYARVEEELRRPDAQADDRGESGVEQYFLAGALHVALPCPEIVRFMLSRMLPRLRPLASAENKFAISGENLNNLIPRVEVDGELITQMDSASLDALNIPRLTVESNPVLNILDLAASWVRKEENAAFDPDRIPLDDEDTYNLLGKGLTTGIDPFHSITLKSLLRSHRPKNLRELVKIKSMERSRDGENESDVLEHVPECLLTYRCAFVKAHYRLSFMTALLTLSYTNRKKFTVILREVNQMGIKILPPDINLSLYEFSQTPKAIRTGLMVVNGFGGKAYSEIERVRKGGDFIDLFDLCRRTDARLINNRLLSNLVKTGGLDSFGLKRSQMLYLIEESADFARKTGGGPTLFDDQPDRGGILTAQEPPQIPELPLQEIIKHEIAAAGYCISHEQFLLYKDIIRRCRALSPFNLSPKLVGREVYVAGYLEHVPVQGISDESDQVVLDLEGCVVTMPLKAFNLYGSAINANAPVLVGGTVARRKDEIYIRALSVFTLRMVQQMSRQVQQITLDMAGEDAATFRLITKIVSQFRAKGAKITINNVSSAPLSRWSAFRIRHSSIFFCPPFYYVLKKIMPEERIMLTVADGMDPELLHALSPTRFPRVRNDSDTMTESDENSTLVDEY